MAKQPALLTTKQLQSVFDVGHVTLYHWRHGTPTHPEPLPFEVDDAKKKKPAIRFRPSAVKQWARKAGVKLVRDPAEVLRLWPNEAPKLEQ
jgi:hypothetical protein